MMSWDEVARSEPELTTDKALVLPSATGGWQPAHGYLEHYERELAGRSIRSILEIGVAGGHSLRLWARVMPSTIVVGMDVDPRAAEHASERVHVRIADATQPDAWKLLTDTPNRSDAWDVIIDDGSHRPVDVLAAFVSFKDRLSLHGLYFVEDMAPSFVGELLVRHKDWCAVSWPCRANADQCLSMLWRRA